MLIPGTRICTRTCLRAVVFETRLRLWQLCVLSTVHPREKLYIFLRTWVQLIGSHKHWVLPLATSWWILELSSHVSRMCFFVWAISSVVVASPLGDVPAFWVLIDDNSMCFGYLLVFCSKPEKLHGSCSVESLGRNYTSNVCVEKVHYTRIPFKEQEILNEGVFLMFLIPLSRRSQNVVKLNGFTAIAHGLKLQVFANKFGLVNFLVTNCCWGFCRWRRRNGNASRVLSTEVRLLAHAPLSSTVAYLSIVKWG